METIKTREELDKAVQGNPRVCVKFSATWCGPCKVTTANIEQVEKDGIDVRFYEVDVDEADEAFITEMGIRNVPVLFVYENGELKNRAVGVQTVDQLKKLY